eukprot:TRINITY_DN2890_c0_g1_i3.p3 TRINITY_DN2890_c0_g1~~TRINITY_DN2890_c0_g1_i3.p3  ORF type:complete len:114 (+),score=8.34 TRINITY_DN2890_c0_g1_i3:105-446(+)
MFSELNNLDYREQVVDLNESTALMRFGVLQQTLQRFQSVPTSLVLKDVALELHNQTEQTIRFEDNGGEQQQQQQQVLVRKHSLPVLFAKLRSLTRHRLNCSDQNTMAIELTQF